MYGQQMVGSLAIIFVHDCISRLMKRMKYNISLQRIIFNNKNAHIRNLFRLV